MNILANETLSQPYEHQLNFSVDAALLRELGERLVGRRHIALAELIKNSYDADATKVVVTLFKDRIEVEDNGQGMDLSEFENFWMRIGSPHKEHERLSRNLKRPVTGSKGVGRLSVQFLAHQIELITISDMSIRSELRAFVDWDNAVQQEDLTQATAQYSQTSASTNFPENKPYGTKLILRKLKHKWTVEDIENLARELWTLQPPQIFGQSSGFTIDLVAPSNPEAAKQFQKQMEAVFDLWDAKIVGQLLDLTPDGKRRSKIVVQFRDGDQYVQEPVFDNYIHRANYEIRIFDLRGKQRFNILVDDARTYMREYGGVHVYDAGFHLPYYGSQQDWLGIEQDHAQRLHRSQLLPENLHVTRALNDLPTNARIFGATFIDTASEKANASESSQSGETTHLAIQITRDRLVENQAFLKLKDFVRWGMDFYATRQRDRREKEEEKYFIQFKDVRSRYDNAIEALETYRREIPPPIYKDLYETLDFVQEASKATDEQYKQRTGLLGALAATGITALAFEHEIGQQKGLLKSVINNLQHLSREQNFHSAVLDENIQQLELLLQRFEQNRLLFSPLMESPDREEVSRLRAKPLLQEIYRMLGPLTRNVPLDINAIDNTLRLPPATIAEWNALFQNVFLNAINALIDIPRIDQLIAIKAYTRGETQYVRIQDTGVGVDLSSAETLFQPFERKLELSPEREQLGVGGTGLGLAIVKMLAENRDCQVHFSKPDEGFATAFELSWREK
ncbi:MAG: ATP-binding protein [Anaerolinea sp.]|nr:ATP-binding protein [Anaerolinea sp.]